MNLQSFIVVILNLFGGNKAFQVFSVRREYSPSTVSLNNDASNIVIGGGDADQCIQLGLELEKKGLARAAFASFHEAATLYQCFLDNYDENDSSNEFGHVTGFTNPDDCSTMLSYSCVRLAHLNNDALGDSNAATRLYREAANIDLHPSSISFDGIGTSIEASGGDLNLSIEAYREALRLFPNNNEIRFHLGVALERLGELDEANRIMEKLRNTEMVHACLVDSWGYVRWHTRSETNLNLHRGTNAMLQVALNAAMNLINENNGIVCEFGVGSGRSLRIIQEMLPLNIPIYGFDTFLGLPKPWNNEPIGACSTGGVMPNIASNVKLYKGLFLDTIPTLKNNSPLAFANIDCDLYTSTYDILDGMHNRVVPGTVIIFDEYICHPTWRHDEFRAWRECCKKFGWQYKYLGFSLSTKQAIVQVT